MRARADLQATVAASDNALEVAAGAGSNPIVVERARDGKMLAETPAVECSTAGVSASRGTF